MAGTGWRPNRVAPVAAGLALLAGTPAVLAAAKVKNPWILAGATAAEPRDRLAVLHGPFQVTVTREGDGQAETPARGLDHLH
jgi:hypothetical protein